MKSVKYLVVVVAMFCICRSYGQVNLRIDSIIVNFNPQPHVGESDTLLVTLHNDSLASTFSGTFNFKALIDSNSFTADTGAAGPLEYPTQNVVEIITPGNSITRNLILHIYNPPFIIGSSGVVIWPIVTASSQVVHISDTAIAQITVLHGVGIDEITDRKLKVYMNGQQLIIQNNGEYLLKNVRLYDVAGKLLQQQEITTSGTLNMGQYSEGVYFAEINFADNTRAVVKVANTK